MPISTVKIKCLPDLLRSYHGGNFGESLQHIVIQFTEVNLEMVELETMESDADIAELKNLIEEHATHTDSAVAVRLLENWDAALEQFVKVMPTDYKRVLEEHRQREKELVA